MITIKTILVCSAWPYAQAVPHLGNLIGSLLSGDVFARYYRLKGHNTLYVSGTDMHGTRAEYEASKKGMSPEELTSNNHKKLKKIIKTFNIKFDNYTNTESVIHKNLVKEIYTKISENGFISTKTEARAYCTNCKKFLADAFIEGKCPKCDAKDAKGNQCDACGALLEAEELIEPYCKFCEKSNIEFKETKHWFLDLNKLEPKIKKYVASHDEWDKNVKNFTKNWIKQGLKPRAVTRDIKWGIPAPFKGAEEKTLFVWFEAVLGYLSATKEVSDNWTNFWFGNDIKQVYALAKDNVPWHTIVFPAILLATEEGYHLPDQIASTEYLNWEGNKKFSKSKNVGIFADEALKLMPATHWRFYLLYDRPESKDTSFSWEELDKTVNQILIGSIGNLVNRTLTFLNKSYKGKIPDAKLNDEDEEILDLINKTQAVVSSNLEEAHIRLSLETIAQFANKVNAYFQKREPWKKEDNKPNTLYVCAQVSKALAVLLQPFIPEFSEKLWNVLNINEDITWNELNKELKSGHKINPPEILVEKIDLKEIKKKYKEMKK